MADGAIRDFRLSANQNIIIRSNYRQLIQIGMNSMDECWNREPKPSCQNLDQNQTQQRNKQSTANATNMKDKRKNGF